MTKTKTNPLDQATISNTLSIKGFDNSRNESAPVPYIMVSDYHAEAEGAIDIGRGVTLKRVSISLKWVECFEYDRIPGETYGTVRRSVGMGWAIDDFYVTRVGGKDLTDKMRENLRAWAIERASAEWSAGRVAAAIPEAIAAERTRRIERALETYHKALNDTEDMAERVESALVAGEPWAWRDRP